MSKLSTVLRLLASRQWGTFRHQLRLNVRRRRLLRAQGQPFIYQLGDFPFICVPGIADSEETFVTDESDAFELTLLRRWLEPGDAFVDVGANLGMYSFAAAHYLGGRGTFLAVEASPELSEQLKKSARQLGHQSLVVEQKAAGNAPGEVTFFLAPPGGSRGEQSLHPDPERSADYVPCQVQMTTLTEIVARHPAAARPAALKMDIEGAEPLALEGAPRSWRSDAGPLAIVEINPTALARSRSSCGALVAHFPANAFERWVQPQYAKTGARQLPLRLLEDTETFTDAWFYNLIAVPRGAIWQDRRTRIQPILEGAQRSQ
jgi:FkbM family methyltransferase